jgi:hypothetical protein
VGYGDIIRIADGTRFHLRSAHRIFAALFPEHPNFLASLDNVLLRLEFGLPSAAIPLTKLPVPLTRGQYLALMKEGCASVADLDKLSDERLKQCLGSAVAAKLRPNEKAVGSGAA